MKKILSAILSLALLVSMLPTSVMPVSAATTEHSVQWDANIDNYVVDADAIWSYQKYFTPNSTEYAGAVWTDKSVFEQSNNFLGEFQITKDSTNTSPVISIEDNNFLVSLSALGATKEVLGYSNLPSDTVFILDASNSMSYNELASMIEATNKAISKLQDLNKHNRIGVVVYGTNGNVLLPIDRYETTKTSGTGQSAYSVYLELIDSNYSTQIRTARTTSGYGFNQRITYNVTDGNGDSVNTYISTGGATYIQGGMYQAESLFEDVQNTSIDTGLIQGGTTRIPIVVLMSDGAPTYGSTSYTNATDANRNLGDGSSNSISDYLVFPAQLTAAHLRSQIEKHYGRDSLFYTLGYDVEHAEARRVLDPANNTSDTVSTWWNNYENTAVGNQISGYSYGNGNNARRITRVESTTDSLTTDRYYTDRYFPATNTNGLVQAFDDIVTEIVIQSKYYPTLVESGEYEMDGYITFEDELGKFMEVKDIKGLVIKDTLYSGEAFTAALNEPGKFGNAATWTEYGEEFLVSVQERLNIRNDQARALLSAAWQSEDKQLSEDHFVGWYADAEGNYLGHWDTKAHTDANYPQNAKYLNKCYFFYGELGGNYGHVAGGDMMYIIVQVHKEIATGDECVIFKVPASLVPMTKYTVEVNSDSYDDATEVELNMTEEQPIRLLFEVGLLDEINEVTLMDYMAEADHSHPVVDSNNNTLGYAFYSNRWGDGHTPDGSGVTDQLDPTGRLATVTHFHPSRENERYYYTENTYITDATGNVYNGSSAPTGDGYYHAYRIIKTTGNNTSEASIEYKYVPIDAQVLSATGDLAIQKDATGWYIPAGQIYQQIARHRIDKTAIDATVGNATGTITYYDYPVLVHPTIGNTVSEDYHIYDFLGNNGRLIMYTAQGIKLSKTIDDVSVATGTKDFVFDVALSQVSNDMKVLDANGNALPATDYEVNGTTVTVTVGNGETVYIVGLPTGTTYNVTERYHSEYRVKEVAAETVTGTTASGTVAQYVLDAVDFVNTASTHKGDLIVAKTVEHNYGDNYVIPGKGFVVVVELKGTANANVNFAATGTAKDDQGNTITVSSVSTDANGKIYLKLGHEDSVRIIGIPENTEYIVSEENLPTGFTQTTPANSLTGVIPTDQTVQADLVNAYSSTGTDGTKVTLKITKNYNGWVNSGDNSSFDFIVQKYVMTTPAAGTNPAIYEWQNTNVTLTADKPVDGIVNTASKNLQDLPLDTLGTHYYRVIEDTTNRVANVTYDASNRYFNITVTDKDMDGSMEIDSVIGYNGVIVSGDANTGWTAATDFTNVYGSAEVVLSMTKDFQNTTGVNIPMSSFVFEVYEADAQGAIAANATPIKTISPGTGGHANIQFSYVTDDMYGVAADQSGTKTKEVVYIVKEQQPVKAGMTYSQAEYKVVVTLTLTSSGVLTATPVITQTKATDGSDVNNTVTSIAFENIYKLDPVATPVIISGVKNFNGPADVADDFVFAIYETPANFVIPNSASPLQTVNNVPGTNDGTLTFRLEGYTKAGHYYYVVKEVQGNNPAVTYDDTVYHVTVEVVAHEDNLQPGETALAKLVVKSMIINEVGGNSNAIAFNNSYTILQNATATVNGDKDLTGKSITADEFSFGLYRDEACTVPVLNPADNNNPIVAKTAAVSGAFKFDFTYTAADTYTYYVKEIPGATNYEAGGRIIGEMTYDDTVYKVVITVSDNGQGILTASTPSITKVGESTEVALKFNNSYDPTDVTDLRFDFVKSFIENATNTAISTWPANGFQFALYEANDRYEITNTTPIRNASASDTNKVYVDLPDYDAAGTFYYIFKELPLEDHTISYDSTEHHIMVTVTDYGNGELAGSVFVNGKIYVKNQTPSTPPSASFRNIHTTVYVDDILQIKKELTNNTGVDISMDNFKFGLFTDEACTNLAMYQGTEAISVADMNGNAFFNYQYDDAFMGTTVNSKTLTYYVAEIIPASAISGMTYDKSVYKVEVTLSYDREDPNNPILTADKVITKIVGANGIKLDNPVTVTDITFDNTYELSNAQFTLKGHKVLKDLNAVNMAVDNDEFTFELYEARVDGSGNWTIGSLKDSAKNQGNLFTFNVSDVNTAGTRYYVVKESTADSLTGITYDTAEYRVTVEVGAGTGTALVGYVSALDKVTYDSLGRPTVSTMAPDSLMIFENIYDPEAATASFTAKKVLHGAELGANTFSFELVEKATGTVMTTVTNDADGTITFNGTYSDAGHYEYLIREVQGNMANITYDTAKFEVIVDVTDNGQGQLEATVTLPKPAVFENTFIPPVTPPGEGEAEPEPESDIIYKSYAFSKVWDDNNNAAGKRPDSITLELYQDGVYVTDMTLTAADGWIGSTVLMYSQGDHVYEWTIKEKDVPQGYKASYDQSAYTVTNTYGNGKAGSTGTGDNSNIGLYIGLSAVCVAAIAALLVLMKFRKKEDEE